MILSSLIAFQILPIHFREPRIEFPRESPVKDATFEIQANWPKQPKNAGNRYFELVVKRPGMEPLVVPFGEYELTFEKYIGDPQDPPFMIKRSAMRAIVYDIFLPGWHWHAQTYMYVHLIGKDSVIAGRRLSMVSRARTDSGEFVWERQFQTGVSDVKSKKEGIWVTLSDKRRLLLAWTDGRTIRRG